jgi:hypothetical protein
MTPQPSSKYPKSIFESAIPSELGAAIATDTPSTLKWSTKGADAPSKKAQITVGYLD